MKKIGLLALLLSATSAQVLAQTNNTPAGAPGMQSRLPPVRGKAEPRPASTTPEPQIEFTADTLTYDDVNNQVEANGKVVLVRDRYRLDADRVIYNQKTGVVEAIGNVRITDPDGSVVRADQAELSDTLRDGVISNILLIRKDGARLAAGSAMRDDPINRFERVVYTPCKICATPDGARPPVWQVKAVKVTYDEDRDQLVFRNATFELFGVPVLYTPYLSSPGPNVQRATGFLSPNLSTDSRLGVGFQLPFFINLSPTNDLTLTPTFYTGSAPLLAADFRQALPGGPVRLGGAATYPRRLDGAGNLASGREFRGYLFTDGQLQHSARWRSTFDGSITTDDTFLRRYNINEQDRLRSYYRLEHFGDQSWFSADAWGFQGLRQTDDQGVIPFILPELSYWRETRLGDGWGRLLLSANALALYRSQGSNTFRLVTSAQWSEDYYSSFGQKLTLTALARGDVYESTGLSRLAINPTDAGEEGARARFLPFGSALLSWPFIGPAFGGVQTIEPMFQFVVAPSHDNSRFPNEDSRTFELEDINLFDIIRSPGLDRLEGGGRVTYGLRYTLAQPDWQLQTEIGQSYRLFGNNPFLIGAGLDAKDSDIVGRTTLHYGRWLDVIHRYRFDNDSLAIRRNELDLLVGSTRNYASVGYSRLNRDIRFEDLEDREELRLTGRVHVTDHWSLYSDTIINLTRRTDDPLTSNDGFSLVRQTAGFAYEDECVFLSLGYRRNNTQDRDFQRGTTFLIRLTLKTLGRDTGGRPRGA